MLVMFHVCRGTTALTHLKWRFAENSKEMTKRLLWWIGNFYQAPALYSHLIKLSSSPSDLSAPDMQSNLMDVSSYDGSSHSPTSVSCMTSSHSRTKRMRTSFKHHQLRSMKSYFAINQNPDAKDLKNLSQKTGLPKRVLQVWFQNARAKWRRNMMRQEQQANGGSMNKIGMGLMLPNISSLTSSMIAENCHMLRSTPTMLEATSDSVLGDPSHPESSPSQTSSMDEIHHLTFAELYWGMDCKVNFL